MQAIVRFNIAIGFPVHEEAPFASISNVCGLVDAVLRRIMRHAMTKHIFRESYKGYVVPTAASRLLAEDLQLRD